MDRGFGGPVWHASGKAATTATSRALARRALDGVGDARLGEWEEAGTGTIVHVRRRLTAGEARLVNVIRDVRGTAEESARVAALLRDAPHLAAYAPT